MNNHPYKPNKSPQKELRQAALEQPGRIRTENLLLRLERFPAFYSQEYAVLLSRLSGASPHRRTLVPQAVPFRVAKSFLGGGNNALQRLNSTLFCIRRIPTLRSLG